ncbi:MAG: hypothetical protein P1U89_03390 [Verrucomicrobiales bacterium]|nr:hypothetical protein [Verrucomicrobiales bacterium]
MKDIASHNLIRLLFLIVTTLMGISVAMGMGLSWKHGLLGALCGGFFAGLVFAIDLTLRQVTLKGFSFGTVGLLIGLLCAWLVTRIQFFEAGWLQQYEEVRQVFDLAIYLGFGFIGMMLALRSKREEFSLLIPYVRFRQDSLQELPILLDSNIIIDGRVDKLCDTGFIGGALIVPQFVLDELQLLADSPVEAKRTPGKRGLEYLKELQNRKKIDVTIYDNDTTTESTVDARLIELGQQLSARILTNDANLAKVARLKGLTVLNLNELAVALKNTLDTGDEIELQLVKEGKESHQAIGYFHDGTMIVVNNGAKSIGSRRKVVVCSTTQTNTGRLIFADLK